MLVGQDREVGKKVRDLGLLKRINEEILKSAGFVLKFYYDSTMDPNLFGPYEIRIETLSVVKKKPKSKKGCNRCQR